MTGTHARARHRRLPSVFLRKRAEFRIDIAQSLREASERGLETQHEAGVQHILVG